MYTSVKRINFWYMHVNDVNEKNGFTDVLDG